MRLYSRKGFGRKEIDFVRIGMRQRKILDGELALFHWFFLDHRFLPQTFSKNLSLKSCPFYFRLLNITTFSLRSTYYISMFCILFIFLTQFSISFLNLTLKIIISQISHLLCPNAFFGKSIEEKKELLRK